MKKIISLLLIFLVFNSYSQVKKEIKITKKQFTDSKILTDFISDISKDCKIQSYVISYNVGSSIKEFTCMTDGIDINIKTLLCKKEKDACFFLEKIKSNCQTEHKSSYKIILE